jgi:hypothetical protein
VNEAEDTIYRKIEAEGLTTLSLMGLGSRNIGICCLAITLTGENFIAGYHVSMKKPSTSNALLHRPTDRPAYDTP